MFRLEDTIGPNARPITYSRRDFYKIGLIRALKSRPSESLYHHPHAKSRITAVFTELLERQFPIENPSQRFSMRSAIKETTGKTTTNVITERVISEAKLLLRHTEWNISEIGYCLGFEKSAHFNNFFKKQTLLSPSAFRHNF